LRALQAMWQQRSVLGALEVFSQDLGSIFRFNLPGFHPVMLVGPQAARFVLVSSRGDFRWRNEGDPVTMLLRHGVLVEDGDSHDRLRRAMNPALHKQMLQTYVEAMTRGTDAVIQQWRPGQTYDMLDEMRKIALVVLLETLFKVDFLPEVERMWQAILATLGYISPGLWMIWKGAPRQGYDDGLRQMDAYLYQIIRARRAHVGEATDLLGLLIEAGLDDDLIRDQILTMLIAGHDTSTALLSWMLVLLGQHPQAMEQARHEVRTVLGQAEPTLAHLPQLVYLGMVMDEALRMYPPIHLGSRVAAEDLEYEGYRIAAGTRVMYSIYLTHRLPAYWPEPSVFRPERFGPDAPRPQPYTYLPFGGGPRNCIGAAYAGVEVKVVMARILQRFDLRLQPGARIHAHMGATLEPRPGVPMIVSTQG
jgi:cytochrome P450